MTIIAEKDRSTVRDVLGRELVEDVELLLFTRGRSRLFVPGRQACLTCEETRELLDEMVSLSDKLHLTTCDVDADPATAVLYNVSAVPTVIVRRHTAETDTAPRPDTAPDETGANVRFLGMPGGYEFSTLLADIVDLSKGRTDLSAEAQAAVRALDTPVHIQVFVTPT